ncbi:MAG: efflux RND transporter permease subunit, partial [Gemmatimonadota bacterium]|nr:efflux RND transporter permease subunit [Gemmatimonadota bacterium]
PPYVRGITFSGEIFTLGNPVEAVLSHPDPERLARIADSVVDGLRRVGGVYDIRSDHVAGIPEVQLELRPEARTLGLTVQELAGQARAAFFGAEAVRVQRGREEVRAYVRLPTEERNSITDVEGYLLRTPGGDKVPIISVASLGMGVSPSALRRRDGQRVVTVTADVDPSVISGDEANEILSGSILADLTAAHPELTYTFGGEQQQQLESIDALYRGFVVALIMIFALLAIPLRSYTKPFIIMAVIPFGFIGVILGHLILGVALSAVSFMGIFGLSGVVVNDSLVMIDFIDKKLREGVPPRTAIVEGAKGRFRPIMLTSVTTFLGFAPLILERAIQAQFLRPFAASLGFGIIFTTAILMMVVPALCALHLHLTPSRRSSTASAG